MSNNVERNTPQPNHMARELVEAFEPIRKRIMVLAGVDDFDNVPRDMLLTDEVILAYQAIQTEQYDPSAKDPMFPPVRPFHEAIRDDIHGADIDSWFKIGGLLRRAFIPPEHRSKVGNDYIVRGRELGVNSDYGVLAAIMAQPTPKVDTHADEPDPAHMP